MTIQPIQRTLSLTMNYHKIISAPITEIDDVSKISIAFEVRSVFEVQAIDQGLGGLKLVEVPVEKPYTKDYDADEPPASWQKEWDLSNWGLLFALDGEQLSLIHI